MRKILGLLTLAGLLACNQPPAPSPSTSTTPAPVTATAPPATPAPQPPTVTVTSTEPPAPVTIQPPPASSTTDRGPVIVPKPLPPNPVEPPPVVEIPPPVCTDPIVIHPAPPEAPGGKPTCTKCGKPVQCPVVAPPPGGGTTPPPTAQSCNGGLTPLYDRDVFHSWRKPNPADPNHPIKVAGLPPGYVPHTVFGVPSLDGMSWGVYERSYLDHFPAGSCIDSIEYQKPCKTLYIETLVGCGTDLGGIVAHRVANGKVMEVNAHIFYQVGATPKTNPLVGPNGVATFNDLPTGRAAAAKAAWARFVAAHPIQ